MLDRLESLGTSWEEDARKALSLFPEVYKIIDESEGFYINKAMTAMSIWLFWCPLLSFARGVPFIPLSNHHLLYIWQRCIYPTRATWLCGEFCWWDLWMRKPRDQARDWVNLKTFCFARSSYIPTLFWAKLNWSFVMAGGIFKVFWDKLS